MTLRELFVGLGFKVDEQSQKNAEYSIQSIKDMGTKLLGAIGVGFSQANMNALAEEFNDINDKIHDATRGLGEQADIQQEILTTANKMKSSYADTAKVGLGFKVDKQSQKKAESSIKSIKAMGTKLLGAIGIGFSLVNMNALAEEFNGINDKIRNATRGLGEQADIQQKILTAANEMKSSYADTAKIVSNLVQESPELFGSVDEAAQFATLTTKLFKSTGKSQQEIVTLQEAINKSFAKGIVDSETINQLYEKAPEAVNLLADSLGVAKENLAKMASEGALGLADLKYAFTSNADVINGAFDELDFSISDALVNIRNQWGYWLDQMNSTTGLTKNIGKVMVQGFSKVMDVLKKATSFVERLADRVGGFGNLLKLVSVLAGSIWVALNAQKILGFLKMAKVFIIGIGKGLGMAQLKMLAIVGVIMALFLIVDDLINFMKGNNSVIGSLFEKAGIDAEKARKAIQTAWAAVCAFLSTIWKNIGDTARAFFSALQAFWERWGGQITNQFRIVWDLLCSLIDPFLRVIQGIVDFIAGIFTGDWERAWNGVKEIFGGIWDAICNLFKAIWDSIYNWFGDKIEAIKETLVNGFNSAIEFLKSLPEKALQWGRDFIDGLINGIKEKISGVVDAVKGVGEKIKSFLHFSRPDEGPLTDYETWMPDFMGGLAEGIRGSSGLVRDALSALTGDMSLDELADSFCGAFDVDKDRIKSVVHNVVDRVKEGLAANKGMLESAMRIMTGDVQNDTVYTALGGGSRTTNVQQTNNITNKFEGGDRAAQTEGAKAMGKTASDTTDEMARALAMGR